MKMSKLMQYVGDTRLVSSEMRDIIADNALAGTLRFHAPDTKDA